MGLFTGGKFLCRSNVDAHVLSKYFAPGGHDSLGGRNVTKARYVEYTDATFTTKNLPQRTWVFLGQ